MFSLNSDTEVGNLGVVTTNHRGHTVEEVARYYLLHERGCKKPCLYDM